MTRVVLLGSPGSGKSSVLVDLLALRAEASTVALDDYVVQIIKERSIVGRLPLSVVRQATDRAIDDFATSERQLVILELAHHKNVALLAADSRLSTLVDFVFICDAPLETLLARNSARKYPVPDYYIYLCKRSVCELRRHGCPTFVSFIDTGKQSSRQAAIQLLEHLDEADAPANVKDGSP